MAKPSTIVPSLLSSVGHPRSLMRTLITPKTKQKNLNKTMVHIAGKMEYQIEHYLVPTRVDGKYTTLEVQREILTLKEYYSKFQTYKKNHLLN